MPELPDLQVFSRNLTKIFKGKKLEQINAKGARKLNVPQKQLSDALEGSKLSKVERAGKELHFEFDNGHILGLHLMLHGQLQLFDGANQNKHTVIALLFEGGKGLALTDFQSAATPALDPGKSGVPDALGVTGKYLAAKLGATRTAVKTVLMDQKVLRGIGNAYADEILYHAMISPFSPSNKIPEEKVKQLAASIKHVLEDAEKQILKHDPEMISGEYRDFLQVHQPRKKETPDGKIIRQKPVGSRKTYYTDDQELFS